MHPVQKAGRSFRNGGGLSSLSLKRPPQEELKGLPSYRLHVRVFLFLAIIRFLVRRLTDRPADREDAAWHGHTSRVCLAYYLDKLFTICLRISLACWHAVRRRGLIRSATRGAGPRCLNATVTILESRGQRPH